MDALPLCQKASKFPLRVMNLQRCRLLVIGFVLCAVNSPERGGR